MTATNGNANGAVNGRATKNYGRRLFPQILDDLARTDPDRECFAIPRSSDPKDGWKTVTFKQYANGVNHVARQIVANCGPAQAGTFPTIAYIGPNDARYVIMALAAVKAGYQALFISPRNSLEGQLSLFDKTDCRVLAFAKSSRAVVETWLREREMHAFEVGSLESWLPEHEVEPFPYAKTFDEAEWDPFCVLHTSGSTGIPKPIVARQGMLAISDQYIVKPDWEGREFFMKSMSHGSKRTFIPMPLFHAAGLYSFFSKTLLYESPVALGLADRPLSAESVLECLEHANAHIAMLPPAIVEDMSQSDTYVEALAKLKAVYFGGGNLPTEAGDRLVEKGVYLGNVIAATECMPFPIYTQPDPKLWQYFIINSEEFGADWRKFDGEDDVYRLVVVRKDKHPGLQGVFYTFPDENEYDTKDLYKAHPTLPDHWIYYGRSDNIIVFSNGEKLNPVTIEDIVSDHPEIKGALVVGAGHFQAGLLLEPFTHPKTEDEAKELIDRVWPLVVTANKETVAHGRIAREFIRISSPEKPFLVAGKGTIQRAGTVKLYKDEIDELYVGVDQLVEEEAPPIDLSSERSLVKSLQDLFSTRIGVEVNLEPDADFFSSGIDSLQVISISRLLKAGLEAAGYEIDAETVATRVIYRNPTVERLARYILSRIRQDDPSLPEDTENGVESMKSLWQKYTRDLPEARLGRANPSDDRQVVILTGTTGTLGSYMLDQMIRNPRVKRIICLNRSEDGEKRQARAMVERGLARDYESKCTFLHADMSRGDFGLSRDAFNELLETADCFIHNAWPVNFNMPVESFEPHIRSLRNIGDFASHSSKRVAVTFISSIGTGDRWDPRSGPLPEKRLEDLTLASGGYGRSKLVASLILEDVARAGDFPAAIIRVGQIAGPEGEAGAWNKQEWLPSIIASSLYLGALPGNLGAMERVDWTAIESIAGLVLDVTGVSQTVHAGEISGYYHGVNPIPTAWSELALAVQEFYGKERIPELVSFGEWLDRLDKSQTGDLEVVDRNPGIKLLDSYRDMASSAAPVVYDMTHTQERSSSMRNAKPVTRELMRHWCEQWRF
ncbi:nonribosomal peptide synthetase [Nemania sp. NC0429]|nr:nonribosomal peptide synthetase [Nemania sp. NC0429]